MPLSRTRVRCDVRCGVPCLRDFPSLCFWRSAHRSAGAVRGITHVAIVWRQCMAECMCRLIVAVLCRHGGRARVLRN